MTQLDRIEEQVNSMARMLQSLLDALLTDADEDEQVVDLSGNASRARDESQSL